MAAPAAQIETEEVKNLAAAVESGVGIAGYHGGEEDAFRDSVEYQFIIGASGSRTRAKSSTTAARQAVIYRRFLDNIEPSEQVYHRDDPADWLRRTAAMLGAGS